MTTSANAALDLLWQALGPDQSLPADFEEAGEGALPSCFAVSDLASASIGAAGMAVAEWCHANGRDIARLQVDRRLASYWFGMTISPIGWSMPPVWDAIAGDYRAADGWIRLHTNAPHHRAAALSVLKVEPEREKVADAVATWKAGDLEQAVVNAGGCAAMMMSREDWHGHSQGSSVSREPLVLHDSFETLNAQTDTPHFDPNRPLSGIRVLDLTRVLAGPVATRFLAGFGAEVLRIDPPDWDEANVAPEVTLGKRCATLDLKSEEGQNRLRSLLAEADIFVSGYRSDALERLGLGHAERRAIRPSLVDVSLDAYGWSGPWKGRRGFDSLVQMSTGIAERGMREAGAERPVPLPVQALDHATGYLMAAMALRGLAEHRRHGHGSRWRSSLAGMAEFLTRLPAVPEPGFAPIANADYDPVREETVWGPAFRLKPPLALDNLSPVWSRAAGPLGSATAEWV